MPVILELQDNFFNVPLSQWVILVWGPWIAGLTRWLSITTQSLGWWPDGPEWEVEQKECLAILICTLLEFCRRYSIIIAQPMKSCSHFHINMFMWRMITIQTEWTWADRESERRAERAEFRRQSKQWNYRGEKSVKCSKLNRWVTIHFSSEPSTWTWNEIKYRCQPQDVTMGRLCQ